MFQRWPVLLLLLAIVGALWLFFDDPGEPPAPDLAGLDLVGTGPEEPGGEGLEADPLGASAQAPQPDPEVDPTDGEAAEAEDPTVGGLELRVTDKDGRLLQPDGVTARIHWMRRPDRPAVHGEPDEYSAIFRFHKLPLGTVRVVVDGDLVVPGKLLGTIHAGQMSRRTLQVDRAAALKFDIQFADRTRPKEVRLSLLDAYEKPVSARYRQLKQADKAPRPQQGRTVRVPPEGVIYGLRDGTYVLKAALLSGAQGQATVSVRLGETAQVILTLEER